MANRVEEPSYEVVRRVGDVEVRAYDPVIQAVTDVAGGFDRVQSEGFRRLAGYIFGGNRQRQSIAMTAPVTTEPVVLAMTSPVSTTANPDQTHRVSFTMPAGMTLASLPEPNDPRVTLVALPRRVVAVLRFSGFSGEARVKDEQHTLLATLGRVGLATRGAPSLARYDPPWTLPFLRRNELQVELDPGAGPSA